MHFEGTCFDFLSLPIFRTTNAAIGSCEVNSHVAKQCSIANEYCPECGWLESRVVLSTHLNSREHATVFDARCLELSLFTDSLTLYRLDTDCTSRVHSISHSSFLSAFPEFSICNDFELVPLSGGAYSSVFNAIDRDSKLRVAVKLLDCRRSSAASALKEFNMMRSFGYFKILFIYILITQSFHCSII